MHILYIDESGGVENTNDTHFVLAGLSVFERSIYHEIAAVETLIGSFGLGLELSDIELHGTHIYNGRGSLWRGIARSERESMLLRVYEYLGSTRNRNVTAFGICVEKAAVSPRDPVEYAFEEISNRFNLFLSRRNRSDSERQKGLIVMDKSGYERPLQRLAREFRVGGTRFGNLRNLAEVPLFVDSHATRLIQIADLVAYAMWRQYEHQDGRFLTPILHKFDSEGGVLHGLVHYRDKARRCYCTACMSREPRGTSDHPNGNPRNG